MHNLNEYERQHRIAERTKKMYPSATRVAVKFVTSIETIFPERDNARTIDIVLGENSFRKLTHEEFEAEN